MNPWIKSASFLTRHKLDIDLATACYRNAREAAAQGRPSDAARFRCLAEQRLDNLDQLWADETAQNPKTVTPA